MLIDISEIMCKPQNLQRPLQEPKVRDSECLVAGGDAPTIPIHLGAYLPNPWSLRSGMPCLLRR